MELNQRADFELHLCWPMGAFQLDLILHVSILTLFLHLLPWRCIPGVKTFRRRCADTPSSNLEDRPTHSLGKITLRPRFSAVHASNFLTYGSIPPLVCVLLSSVVVAVLPGESWPAVEVRFRNLIRLDDLTVLSDNRVMQNAEFRLDGFAAAFYSILLHTGLCGPLTD